MSRDVRGRVYAIYFASGSLGGVLGNFIYSLTSSQGLTASLITSSIMYILSGIVILIAVRSLEVQSES